MSDNKNKSRRGFIRKASLAAISVGALSSVKASNRSNREGGGCNPCTLDYYGQGPFYTENPPTIVDHQLADANEPGTRIIISGVVRTLDCTQFIPNTVIDVWHANDPGEYDNVGFNLRGQMLSNSKGFYMFETIYPGKYQNGLVFRPSHIHFKITPPGFPTLTTQLYFEGDPDLTTDPASSLTSGTYDASDRIIALTDNGQGTLEGTWDIIVDGNGTATGMEEMHMDQGMIYEVSPNPYSEQININYGIFKKSSVVISVFDVNGKLVDETDEGVKAPDKYTTSWRPDSALSNGHYFVSLKMNDMQVHYIKTVLSR